MVERGVSGVQLAFCAGSTAGVWTVAVRSVAYTTRIRRTVRACARRRGDVRARCRGAAGCTRAGEVAARPMPRVVYTGTKILPNFLPKQAISASSNLTMLRLFCFTMRCKGQPPRLWRGCHAEGRGFEPLHPLRKKPRKRGLLFVGVATLVSSNPPLGQPFLLSLLATRGRT